MNDQEQPVVDHPGRSDGSLGSEGGKSRNVRNFFFLRQILKILFL